MPLTPADMTPLPASGIVVRLVPQTVAPSDNNGKPWQPARGKHALSTTTYSIGGHSVHIGIEYDRPGGDMRGVCIEMHKEGAFSRSLLTILARLTSLLIQEKVPVQRIARILSSLQYEPNGSVEGHEPAAGQPAIAEAASVTDLIAKVLLSEASR
jgi:hypothetical protein